MALKPLFPNDILLFISQAKQREKKAKSPQKSKTNVFGSQWFTSFPFPNCSLVLLLHLSVAFEREWKHFSSPEAGRWHGGMVFAVACRLRTGLSHLPISPSPSSKPVVVRPLICCNLPLQPRCQDRSYFRSSSRLSSVAKQDFRDTKGEEMTGEAKKTADKKRLEIKWWEERGQVRRTVWKR